MVSTTGIALKWYGIDYKPPYAIRYEERSKDDFDDELHPIYTDRTFQQTFYKPRTNSFTKSSSPSAPQSPSRASSQSSFHATKHISSLSFTIPNMEQTLFPFQPSLQSHDCYRCTGSCRGQATFADMINANDQLVWDARNSNASKAANRRLKAHAVPTNSNGKSSKTITAFQ